VEAKVPKLDEDGEPIPDEDEVPADAEDDDQITPRRRPSTLRNSLTAGLLPTVNPRIC